MNRSKLILTLWMFGLLSASAQLEWRVSVKMFTDPEGKLTFERNPPPFWTPVCSPTEISNRIYEANATLDKLGRGYRFRLMEVLRLPVNTAPLPDSAPAWFDVVATTSTRNDLNDKALANRAAFKFRDDAINFYITGALVSPDGGNAPKPGQGDVIII